MNVDGREARAELTWACVWCGKHCAAVRVLRTGERMLAHAMPYCAHFETLGPVEFMQATRAHLRRQRWGLE